MRCAAALSPFRPHFPLRTLTPNNTRNPQVNRVLSEAAASPNPIKLTFLCSPGNPTGTLIPLADIRAVLANPDYKGLVVVDEAYVDFSAEGTSAVQLLVQEGYENLVVMQTLSKGFGLAAIRFVPTLHPTLVALRRLINPPKSQTRNRLLLPTPHPDPQ